MSKKVTELNSQDIYNFVVKGGNKLSHEVSESHKRAFRRVHRSNGRIPLMDGE
jgi:hypothetical protein